MSAPERALTTDLRPADDKKVPSGEIAHQNFVRTGEKCISMDLASEMMTRGEHARRTAGAPVASEPAAPGGAPCCSLACSSQGVCASNFL